MARVLIVAYTKYFQDSRVKRNAEALAGRGDWVDVICLADGPSGPRRGVNVIALAIPRYRGDSKSAYVRSYLRFFAMASLRATALSRIKPYDVVIVCTMPDAAVLCALGPRLYGARIVLDIHDTMPELYQDKFKGIVGAIGGKLLMLEERASAWLAHRVLAVHEPHRQRLTYAGIPARKLTVVMNLPDPRVFRPSPYSEAPVPGTDSPGKEHGHVSTVEPSPKPLRGPRDGDVFGLVCHGTVTSRLGLDLAIRAVGLVRNAIPSIHLNVIGEGDFLPAAQDLTRKLGLERYVTFTPPIAVEQLPPALTRAAVGIVPNRPSRATHLMLPAKLLEYAALGIPVIAARLYTVEYHFPAGTVRYFEPGDVNDLAGAIEELYRDPEKRRILSRRAAQVAADLNWEHQRTQLFNTVDSLLAANSASATNCDEFKPASQTGDFSQAGGRSCDTAKP